MFPGRVAHAGTVQDGEEEQSTFVLCASKLDRAWNGPVIAHRTWGAALTFGCPSWAASGQLHTVALQQNLQGAPCTGPKLGEFSPSPWAPAWCCCRAVVERGTLTFIADLSFSKDQKLPQALENHRRDLMSARKPAAQG